MVLTSIGEIGVEGEGFDLILRPSLYAMSKLGNPAEIVEIFHSVMGECPQLADCMTVISCCSNENVSFLIGWFEEKDGILQYIPGKMSVNDIVVISRCLLKHGIIGDVKKVEKERPEDREFIKEFDARENAALAMAHLGFTEKEAWSLTMTTLVESLMLKYPNRKSKAPGASAPTSKEHDLTMGWYDKIQTKRKSKLVK